MKVTNLGRQTAGKIFNDSTYIPSVSTMKKVINLLKKLDPKVKMEDFLIFKKHTYNGCAFYVRLILFFYRYKKIVVI